MPVRRTVFVALTVAVLVVPLFAGCGSGARSGDDDDILVFAAIPSEEGQRLEQSFAPTVRALEEALGREIEFMPASSNAGVIEAQVAERVDIAVYGAFSYYLARTRADIEPVAAPVPAPSAPRGAESYGVVRGNDPAVQDLADVAQRNVCFTDPGSTTGYLQPLASLIEAGVEASEIESVFAGGHDAAVSSLLAGDCDVAFVGDVFIDEILPAQGILKEGDVRQFYTSPLIPAPPVVVGDWLSEEDRTTIADTLTSLTAESLATEGHCSGDEVVPGPDQWGEKAGVDTCPLDAAGSWAYAPAEEADYEQIVEICEVTRAEVCTE